ncbi:barstar family protein [Streptacidiphilus sp. ASG 303]|uniref:barstar family protein n=1 Tax=Streptacidiphilus sp. ASG 303 TaxID=2896847 RepID=UPI001E3A190C|nr:barstar family protein [Streptacidiphilus sp. ASG 303]MCD0485629.1 barstar family protein [Streptacidiphilus sp. ASG 303]
MLTIDVSSVTDERELHAVLAQTLHFPDFYGSNWDAFWDAITGLVEIPDHVRLTGWKHLSDRIPRGAIMLQRALDDYRQRCRPQFLAEYR